MVHADEKRFDLAIPKLERVVNLKEFSGVSQIAFWMGYSYQAVGRSREAIPFLERASRLTGAAMALRLLAYALSGQGRWPEAIQVYERANAIDPESYLGHQLLGQAFHKVGDRNGAVHHLEEALSLLGKGELSPPERDARRKIRSMLKIVRQADAGGRQIEVAPTGSDQG